MRAGISPPSQQKEVVFFRLFFRILLLPCYQMLLFLYSVDFLFVCFSAGQAKKRSNSVGIDYLSFWGGMWESAVRAERKEKQDMSFP